MCKKSQMYICDDTGFTLVLLTNLKKRILSLTCENTLGLCWDSDSLYKSGDIQRDAVGSIAGVKPSLRSVN